MLYTRNGDQGETRTWGCNQKISKSSAQAEALGALDEVNSLLGVIKVKADGANALILEEVQQNLFIIQAEVAGAPKAMSQEKVLVIEKIVDSIEHELPPIKTFFVAGGTELSAQFDYARTIARRAERRVVALIEQQKVSQATLAYLNRLSSLLYALARLENHRAGIQEEKPVY